MLAGPLFDDVSGISTSRFHLQEGEKKGEQKGKRKERRLTIQIRLIIQSFVEDLIELRYIRARSGAPIEKQARIRHLETTDMTSKTPIAKPRRASNPYLPRLIALVNLSIKVPQVHDV